MLGGMKIDAHTTQADVLKLSEAVLRRELLRHTPLNLRHFLRYLILFLLFPGMVFGFRVGLLITLLFCAWLGGLLVLSPDSAAASISIGAWFALGLAVLAVVQAQVLRKGLAECRRRRAYREAQQGLKHPQQSPKHFSLSWNRSPKEKDFLVSSLVFRAPKKGIYAFLLRVQQYDGRRIITGGVTGTSIVHAQGKPGHELQSLTLYRLEPGNHELTWAIPAAGGTPRADITLLNRAL